LTSGITVEDPPHLFARGSVFRGRFADRNSPIAYGYDGPDLPVYFNQGPVLNVSAASIRNEAADDLQQAARRMGFAFDSRSRPRTIVEFPANEADMLLSGALLNGQALAGRALAVDERIGRGHIVMFALRPFWRWETQGSYFLAFNAILNWNDLDAGK
jgi:hypothetical protein